MSLDPGEGIFLPYEKPICRLERTETALSDCTTDGLVLAAGELSNLPHGEVRTCKDELLSVALDRFG